MFPDKGLAGGALSLRRCPESTGTCFPFRLAQLALGFSSSLLCHVTCFQGCMVQGRGLWVGGRMKVGGHEERFGFFNIFPNNGESVAKTWHRMSVKAVSTLQGTNCDLKELILPWADLFQHRFDDSPSPEADGCDCPQACCSVLCVLKSLSP